MKDGLNGLIRLNRLNVKGTCQTSSAVIPASVMLRCRHSGEGRNPGKMGLQFRLCIADIAWDKEKHWDRW